MKHNSFLWIFAVFTLSLAQNDQFLVSRQQFALDLFKNTQMGSNVLISPLSIDFVLNLLLLGSTKGTNKDLKNGLEYPKRFSAKTIESNLEMWSNAVKMINGAELATKIYVNQSVAVKYSYKLLIKKTLNSDLEKIAFIRSKFATDKINKWIANQTHDLIQNMIKDGIIDKRTLMILINCIYFSGKWKDQFYPSMKLFENFTAIDGSKTNIEFMYQEASLPFCSNINELKGASAVSLAYENSTASMLIVLPPNNIEFLPWLSSITQINWTAVDDSLKPKDVILKIPKFNIEFDKDIKNDLEIMGFKSIFNDHVNLDKIFLSQPAKIKNLFHKTMIKVDEVGTVAVGASIIISVDSLPIKQWKFTANRPFLFFIRSGPTIMFIGQYVK